MLARPMYGLRETMATNASSGSAAFKRFEAEGWSARAASYGDLTGRVTSRAAVSLLDACAITEGTRLVDVAGGFVLNHLPHPERCVREAARVLVPGGQAAFSVWECPERNRLIGLMGDAVERAGLSRDEAIPDGPDSERFADQAAFAGLLEAAGFEEVRVSELQLDVDVPGADELWNGLLGGMVRVASVVEDHGDEELRRIRGAFGELCGQVRVDGGGLKLPAIVKIASGRTPGGGK